jgi:hypothetical protein
MEPGLLPALTIKSGGEITPFWQRILKFFLYPFHAGPLLYIALPSAASTLTRMGLEI